MNNKKETDNVSDVSERKVTKNASAKQNNRRVRDGKPVRRASAAWSETVALEDARNDPEWYASIPELMDASASLNYFNPVGSPTYFGTDDMVLDGVLESVPGLMKIPYMPVLGVSSDNTSAVNMAARNLYTFVRRIMSAHSGDYEPPDLMLYTVAMASAYSYLAWMRRVYGVIGLYTQLNKYMPDSLLFEMGIDYQDIRDKGMLLYHYIQVYQNKLGSFAIPTSLYYFTRQLWMCSNLYVDAPTNKAQMYMFNPIGFWKYNELDGAGRLDFVSLPGNMKIDDMVTFGDALMSSLVASEDVFTMSGDILHAFGDDGIFKMDALPIDYEVRPAYVPEVLMQIHNATIFEAKSANFRSITQDTSTGPNGGAIICEPLVLMTREEQGVIYAGKRLLSVPMDNVEPKFTMVATRLMAFAKHDEGIVGRVTSCGTEICFRPTITLYRDVDGDWEWNSTYSVQYANWITDVTDAAQFSTYLSYLTNLSAFEYHPFTSCWIKSGDKVKLMFYNFDIDNYTAVDFAAVNRMHECALMSMYKVPVMGLFDRKTTK